LDDKLVFHTDVTKILSADSYLASRFSPDLPTPPPADPNALRDFLDVVDVVTNRTLLQYRSAENQRGPLNEVCKLISRATEAVRSPVSPPIRELGEVTKDAEQTLSFFVPLLQTETSIRRLAEWVRFQVSTSYLQDLFWDANNEQELQYTLDVYKRHYPTDSAFINTAVKILGRHPFGYAGERLNHNDWSPADFFLAYSFWGFIKGCRFARGLTEDDIYVVHWLRERAITDSEGATIGDQETLGVKIPWGPLVRAQMDSLTADTSVEPLTKGLIKLRRYSIAESKNAITRRNRHDFLATGLMYFNQTIGVKETFLVDTFAQFTGDVAAGTNPGPGDCAKFLLQRVNRRIRKSRAMGTIRYLASNNSRVSEFIQKGV
jgi:hypothetical protein